MCSTEVEANAVSVHPELDLEVTVGDDYVRVAVISDIEETVPMLIAERNIIVLIPVEQFTIVYCCTT